MTITAKILADSITTQGSRVTTFELEYPRFIHSELMTHRIFSKNAASSRAIPINRAIELLQENPAMPVHWGKNQAGMQASGELDPIQIEAAKAVWLAARDSAISHIKVLTDMGGHKQWVNRIGEPWQVIKTVLTGTDFENLWWLRDHKDAQPEFAVLAKLMHTAYEESTPFRLFRGEWHVPYVNVKRTESTLEYWLDEETQIDVETAKKISASCCAQVSYRKLDDSLNKALDIYEKLVSMGTPHFSPFEHQATPMPGDHEWPEGATHKDIHGSTWSGNLREWVQHRQLIMKQKKIDAFSTLDPIRIKLT